MEHINFADPPSKQAWGINKNFAEYGGGTGGGLTDQELRASPVSVSPVMFAGGNEKPVLTAGAVQALPNQQARQATVANPLDNDIYVLQNGIEFPVFARGYFSFFGIENLNDLSLKSEVDGTVYVRWER